MFLNKNKVEIIKEKLQWQLENRIIKKIIHFIDINYGHLFIDKNTKNSIIIPKIALVKQEVYQDLYCCSNKSNTKEIIYSSNLRTGPVSLFTKLSADFIIVKTENDPECNIWKEKWFDCKQKPIEFYESLKTKPYNDGDIKQNHPQGEYSVSVNDINWNKYDIVISLDIAIPSRITKKFPNVVWCYYISEPCMRSYNKSKTSPIDGYDLFLNQKFRLHRILPSCSNHEIEFPYFFQKYGCFNKFLDVKIKQDNKSNIIVEKLSSKELRLNQFNMLKSYGSVIYTSGSVEEHINNLVNCKYFISFGNIIRWGNSLIEAISAGALAIAIPTKFWSYSLLTKKTSVKDFNDLLNRIKYFEENKESYYEELGKQRILLNYLCFQRPLNDLINKSNEILLSRNCI